MFELNDGRIRQLRHALARLQRPDQRYVSLAFFTADEVALLRQTALAQDFRRAQNEIRHKGRAVFQDFDVCFPAQELEPLIRSQRSLRQDFSGRQSICQTRPSLRLSTSRISPFSTILSERAVLAFTVMACGTGRLW